MRVAGIKGYSFMIFMLFILSMELWIGWNGWRNPLMALCGLGALVFTGIYHIKFNFSLRNISLCALYYFAYLVVGNTFRLQLLFTQVPTTLVPIICIICIQDNYKPIIFKYITRYYSILIVISLVVYFAVLAVNLPSLGTMSYGSDGAYGAFSNYFFYIKQVSGNATFSRFNGPFLEPGYVGMIGAFILMANNFNLKQRANKIILGSVIISFSLSGFLLVLCGYLFCRICQGKAQLGRLFPLCLLLFVVICVGTLYNGGENVINNLIISRLQFDSDRGFVGNNRTSLAILRMYIDMWTDKDLLLHGYDESAFIGLREWEQIGTGYVYFMVTHGLIHLIYLALFYLYGFFYAKDKLYAFFFFVIICMSFWQRNYSLWFSWVICYHYALVTNTSMNNRVTN